MNLLPLLLCLVVLPAPATPVATVTAFPAAQVTGPAISLGEVARLEGTDPGLLETLKSLDLGPSPLPGKERPLDLSTLPIRLRQRGINPSLVSLQGPSRLQVTRASQTIPGEELVKAALEATRERLKTTSGSSDELRLEPLKVPGPVTAALGPYQVEVENSGGVFGSSVTAMVFVRSGGTRIASVPVQFRLQRLGDVVVADRDLPRKTLVEESSVRLERRDLATLPKDVVRDIAGLKGLQVRSPLGKGQALTLSALEERPLVENRAEVTIVATAGRIRISALGTALEPGRQGQTIRVMNRTANQELRAVVIDAQTVQAVLGAE